MIGIIIALSVIIVLLILCIIFKSLQISVLQNELDKTKSSEHGWEMHYEMLKEEIADARAVSKKLKTFFNEEKKKFCGEHEEYCKQCKFNVLVGYEPWFNEETYICAKTINPECPEFEIKDIKKYE